MFRKTRRFLPLVLILTAGCVEQTQIITLNPDGRGKTEYEIFGPLQEGNVGPGPGPMEKKNRRSRKC